MTQKLRVGDETANAAIGEMEANVCCAFRFKLIGRKITIGLAANSSAVFQDSATFFD